MRMPKLFCAAGRDARQQAAALFAGEQYPDFAALFDTVGPDDVQAMFARWARRDRCTMSVVEPK